MARLAGTFEAVAIAVKEKETKVFRLKTGLAFESQMHGASRWLAELWDCSPQAINTLARIFETFSANEITPDIPLSLWNAVMETDDPQAWLARALAEGLSARGVRDANDNLRGKHLSSTAFCGRVVVTTRDVPTGTLTVKGLPLSGAAPEVMDVVAREVLTKEETK